MRSDQIFTDDAAGEKMLLNDALEYGRVALAVPRTFRVHDRNGTSLADAEAVGFCAKDAALLGELQLFEPSLQETPCGKATLLITALRFSLIAAEKNMAPRHRHTNAGRDFSLGIRHAGSIFNACLAV